MGSVATQDLDGGDPLDRVVTDPVNVAGTAHTELFEKLAAGDRPAEEGVLAGTCWGHAELQGNREPSSLPIRDYRRRGAVEGTHLFASIRRNSSRSNYLTHSGGVLEFESWPMALS